LEWRDDRQESPAVVYAQGGDGYEERDVLLEWRDDGYEQRDDGLE
jgi:hypothetical protein